MTTRSTARVLRIATRQSPLAMWQARHVAGLLAQQGIGSELVPLVSSGDLDTRPLDQPPPEGGVRETGVFTKRIQEALLVGDADLAVHSLKDLPTASDPRLTLGAVPSRESVLDCLVTAEPTSLDQLPPGARVGTGSRRRVAQLLHRRPDLHPASIRGNLQTRLAKLESGEFDAIVLAEAGLLRLELTEVIRQPLPLDVMLPAPGQGALGIEVRHDDADALAAVGKIDDPLARACVSAERHVLAALDGGCLAPIAAYATVDERSLELWVRVLSHDGRERLQWRDRLESIEADWQGPALTLAAAAAEALLAQEAPRLIRQSRSLH